jgi:uncharacterized protein YPO0396
LIDTARTEQAFEIHHLASNMEDIGNGWDDLIHDSLQYPADGMSRPETVGVVRNYDLELGSGLWTPQQVFPA